MNDLFWYLVQGLAAVTLGVAAGLLTRALFHWFDARRARSHPHPQGKHWFFGPEAPVNPHEGDIWFKFERDEYPPDTLHPYNTKERP